MSKYIGLKLEQINEYSVRATYRGAEVTFVFESDKNAVSDYLVKNPTDLDMVSDEEFETMKKAARSFNNF